ncbi:MAG: hypothetical protein Q8936_02800 [Bacillota bacterium]|nr:hypothetical protein [Bacillota bacterium]
MNKNSNIGIITLCGLIVGPILGSGILLLPPVAYGIIGSWAILAWIIIMALGAVFAYVFIFLTLKSPGNEGVAIAVGDTLGGFWRELTSNFLTTAVCFGPVAVVMTASGFIKNFSLFSNVPTELIAFVIELICAAGILNLDSLVACADVFFLSNAIIGLSAGFRLLNDIRLRIAIAILITAFALLLIKATLWSIGILIVVTLVSLYNNRKVSSYVNT